MDNKPATDAFSKGIFEYRSVEKRKLVLSLSITIIVMLVELAGGMLTNSIALVSDAGHMFTHCFAIGISLLAIIIAGRPPCHHKTFGLYRAEIIAAFVNGLFLLLIVAVILFQAIMRIAHPKQIMSLHMIVIACIGMLVNITSILILIGSHKKDLNIKSVFYHMIADTASSAVIIMAGIAIFLTGWTIIDPLVSMGISAVILFWAIGLLRESSRVLLEMAPAGLDLERINTDLKDTFPMVKEIYNAHIWTITTDMMVYSAHICFDPSYEQQKQESAIVKINSHLKEKYGVIESTIQISSGGHTGICEKISTPSLDDI